MDAWPQILTIFKHYAGGGDVKNKPMMQGKPPTEITLPQFKGLMNDIGAVDVVCTHFAVYQVFTKMQDDFTTCLNANQFAEALCAIAAFKNPAPYLPLHIRVRRFLNDQFLPLMATKGIIRKQRKGARQSLLGKLPRARTGSEGPIAMGSMRGFFRGGPRGSTASMGGRDRGSMTGDLWMGKPVGSPNSPSPTHSQRQDSQALAGEVNSFPSALPDVLNSASCRDMLPAEVPMEMSSIGSPNRPTATAAKRTSAAAKSMQDALNAGRLGASTFGAVHASFDMSGIVDGGVGGRSARKDSTVSQPQRRASLRDIADVPVSPRSARSLSRRGSLTNDGRLSLR